MSTPLRVLLLEDDSADAELITAELEDAGYTLRWSRAQTREQFIAHLKSGEHDIVLADYSLPSFDGLSALRMMRAEGVDLPFVLISGTIGEETAIESLKAGATDYVLKGRLERLPPVVERALRERAIEVQRRRAEEERAALLEFARDIAGVLDLDQLLARVERRVAGLLPCDVVATFAWDAERQAFKLLSQFGMSEGAALQLGSQSFPIDPELLARAEGTTVVLNDLSDLPLLSSELLIRLRVTALVAISLQVRGSFLGTFVAASTAGHRFSTHQVQLLESVARQLAVAIEASGLYRAQQEEAEVSAALVRVGHDLISSLDQPVLLERLCRLTTEVLACDYSHTFLWNEEQGCYLPVAGWGDSAERWESIRVVRIPADRFQRYAERLRAGEVMLVGADTSNDEGYAHLGIIPTAAILMALHRGTELIGFQSAGFFERDASFNAAQKRIARGIGQVASLALENARLLGELEQANRIKTDFLASMSHELRTPLNVILGYHGLLLEGEFGRLEPEQGQTLERAQQSAQTLLELIEATLDLTRMDSGVVPLDVTEVQLERLLTQLESEVYSPSIPPAVTFAWEVAPEIEGLRTDFLKLKIILKNLIGNALKFTASGSVRVVARPHPDGVEISVIDTGIGIAPDALPLIFDPFQQADRSIGERYGGVGLGLYIASRLASTLGARVEAESELGRGSIFRIHLPSL